MICSCDSISAPKRPIGSVVGRFAPSPTGRMHLGNLLTALVSWLSVRSQGGRYILRIEDLDPQRSRLEYAKLIEDDLHWLGFDWDEGGVDNMDEYGPYVQSRRSDFYLEALGKLNQLGVTYPCVCTRADILATQAPHRSDSQVIYAGTCRPAIMPRPVNSSFDFPERPHSIRLWVPDDCSISFIDRVYGQQSVRLAEECGDFVLRRADLAWAYQLAVVVDDALMGVTEVVRGNDLLSSSARQIYIYQLLGFTPPRFAHLPLVSNPSGQRLSKRDASLAMDVLRQRFSPQQIVGWLANIVGLIPEPTPCSPSELIPLFNWSKIPNTQAVIVNPIE